MMVKCTRCGATEERVGRLGYRAGLCQKCQTLVAAANRRWLEPRPTPPVEGK